MDFSGVRRRFACWLVLLLACQPTEEDQAAPQWEAARAQWYIQKDPAAYLAWNAVDPHTPEGIEAQHLLREAERQYRDGVNQVAAGDPRTRETFERAQRVAPMNPDLYLPLARAYRDRAQGDPHLYIRAAYCYGMFLLLRPDHPDAPDARRELAEIDPDAPLLLDVPDAPRAPEANAEAPVPSWPLIAALCALVLALAAIFALLWRARSSVFDLAQLAMRKPELHPAIAYLVGSLRHELLKHRIGAVADAVDAFVRGRASEGQQEFLRGRLFGGEPLERAWEGHVRAFERALGPELDLRRRDRAFRRSHVAVRRLAALESRVSRGDKRAAQSLARAHATLRELDRELASLVRKLVRTSVDGALLRAVVDEVRTEYAPGRVKLDEVVIRAPEPAPFVEVFRVDLVLVLKNVVRNAILAVGRGEEPRRIALDVGGEVQATGEETVRVRVRDSSDEPLTTEDLQSGAIDRGLGLVMAALSRYDGTLTVEDGEGFAKSVVLRFFRAYAEDE